MATPLLQTLTPDYPSWFCHDLQNGLHFEILSIWQFIGTQISKVDSLLEGTAASSIQGLTLSESNYDWAIELLKERFGKPQQIIATHMDELLKIKACTSDALRQVYDKINIHVRGLNSLGIDSGQYGSLLIPVIMTKMSNDTRLRIDEV